MFVLQVILLEGVGGVNSFRVKIFFLGNMFNYFEYIYIYIYIIVCLKLNRQYKFYKKEKEGIN